MRIDTKETSNAIKQGQIRKNSKGNKIALVVDGFQHNGIEYIRYLRMEKQAWKKRDSMAMAVSELRIFKEVFTEPYSGTMQIQATPADDLIDVNYPEYAQLRDIMYKGGHFNEK